MARYAYDVNTTQRYIDVHKQFQGGLKTVDTDDALGAVFLRQAENVSLSEFGFIEKRYGTYENFKKQISGNLQGYWEFQNHIIFAVNGIFYVDEVTNPVTTTTILKENNDWRYPTVLPETFQTTRDMNGVNINGVLYIFTGDYPIYVSVVDSVLKFYWISIDIPTYDEIVVVGHNLLENDYEDVYEFDGSNTTLVNSQGTEENPFYIKQSNWFPQFPYVEEVSNGDTNANKLNVEFSYNRDARVNVDSTTPYYEVFLNSASFAPAGSTASDAFTEIDLKNVTFETLNTNSNETNSIVEVELPEIFPSNYNFGDNSVIFTAPIRTGSWYRVALTNDSINDIQYDWDTFGGFNVSFYSDNTDTVILPNRLLKKVENGEAYLKLNPEYFSENQTILSRISVGTWLSTLELDGVRLHQNLEVSPTAYQLSQSTIKVSITQLLAGTWDFRFNFQFRKFSTVENITVIDNTVHSIFNVSITPEKLQDRPGDEGVGIKPHPIWSCNKVLEHYGKLMVWGSTEMPTAVFYSFPDRPTFFPSKFYLDFTNDENNAVQSVTSFMNILVVQTEDRTWGIRGNSGLIDAPAPYVPFSINPSMGTIAYKSVRAVRNKLFFLSKQGVASLNSLYAVDEMYNVKFEDLNVRNIVPQDTKAVGIQYDNQYWLNFPKYGITLRWYIDKSAWVMDRFGSYVDELGNVVTKVGAWNQFNGVFKWQIKNGKLEFISYPSRFTTDDTLSIYKIGIDYSLPYDLGKTYAAKLETSFLNQNYPFHPKNYKEAKLDFTLQNEYNLSRDAVYTMDLNEDIDASGSVHKIDNISLIRNHIYRIYYKFGTFEIENLDGGSFVGSISASYDGGRFDSLLIGSDVIKGYFFDLQIANNAVTSLMIVNADNNDTEYLSGEDITITELGNGDYSVQFYTPNHLNGLYDILIEGNYQFYDGGAVMYDVTYDDSLTFQTWVISEEQTLNLDNIQSYDQSKAVVAFDLKGRLGEWVFGTSDFGDKVTAVKTIKLSGRGYNSKIYMEDYTNSKWTLESLGITYKMKRARNR